MVVVVDEIEMDVQEGMMTVKTGQLETGVELLGVMMEVVVEVVMTDEVGMIGMVVTGTEALVVEIEVMVEIEAMTAVAAVVLIEAMVVTEMEEEDLEVVTEEIVMATVAVIVALADMVIVIVVVVVGLVTGEVTAHHETDMVTGTGDSVVAGILHLGKDQSWLYNHVANQQNLQVMQTLGLLSLEMQSPLIPHDLKRCLEMKE